MQHSMITDPLNASDSNDYHLLPASEKQIRFALEIAARTKAKLPVDFKSDRQKLSRWISEHKPQMRGNLLDNYPSSKQVAFAERIARLKRRTVPHQCFRDKTMMSRWIDGNL